MSVTENRSSMSALMKDLFPVVREAGAAILSVYERQVAADYKSDGSPVTEADKVAETIILKALRDLDPETVIISEENVDSHSIAAPDRFFLVDPLDGTKEFLKRDGKGSFTVNIALVESGLPVMGVVYAPALDRLFSGVVGEGAAEAKDGKTRVISAREVEETGPVAVASASHRDAETDAWLTEHNISKTISIGSSLKFCLVAAGEADVYPRFGPTMEWDTAAGHAVLRAAGGNVTHPDGRVFRYGKPEYRNGPFVAKNEQF